MEFHGAPATYGLIAANLIASIYALAVDHKFAAHFAFHVGAITRKNQHYRVFTSSFLHGDFFHLAFNMMTLFFFGPTVEETLGTDGLLVIYFGAIMASGVVSFFVNRRNLEYTSLGASDGVAGIVLAYCVFNPLGSIYFLLIPIPIPAILFGVLFIVISAGMIRRDTGRIAHEAHLAGALAGVLLTIAMRPDLIAKAFA